MDHPRRFWSDLPVEILELFLHLLYFTDRVRFAAVCKTWRSAAARHRSPPIPLLTLPIDNTDPQSLSVVSPAEDGKIHRLKIPIATAAHCFGSSRGWLFMNAPPLGFHLLNPFTKEQLQLPQLLGRNQSRICNPQLFVAASMSSTTTGGCMVAALGASSKLALCRLGDKAWSLFPNPPICDFLFHGGLLYCLGPLGRLTVLGFYPKPVIKESCSPTAMGINFNTGFKSIYLVPRGEELLMVAAQHEASNCIDSIVRLDVFRLNPGRTEWVPLKDLDGWTLFLGRSCSASFQASRYPAFEPNCIFFLGHGGCHLFNLEDESIRQFGLYHTCFRRPEHFWLLHNAAA